MLTTDDSRPIDPDVLSGCRLYGDDLSDAEIARWYAEEEEAYYRMQAIRDIGNSVYEYSHLNEFHAFRFVRKRLSGATVLAFGAGLGDEVAPLLTSANCQCIFVESSEGFLSALNTRFPDSAAIKADSSGRIELSSGSVDAITCFGVLHHIPNVTTVLGEFHRVLKPGGILLVREPASWMGDWRREREGLTKNERGIGRSWLMYKLSVLGFLLLQQPRPCLFLPIYRVAQWMGVGRATNSRAFVLLDHVLSLALAWNDNYWRDTLPKKFAPSSYFYLAERTEKATRAENSS